MLLVICTLYCLPLALLLAARGTTWYVAAKLLASTAFLAAALGLAVAAGHTDRLLAALPALLFCFAGDVALAVYNRARKKAAMGAGMLLFAAGHVAFFGWMCTAQAFRPADLLWPVPFALALAGLLRLPGITAKRQMRGAILAYGFLVSLMFTKSLTVAAGQPSAAAWLFCVGAALLLVSDAIIVFLYFYKAPGPAVHIANLLTYYVGMLAVALSLWW